MNETIAPAANFGNLEVVSFESRRAKEMAALIENMGGLPLVAPSMREVPLEENPVAFKFAEKLFAGELNAIICMTGVGIRTLFEVLETRHPREKIVAALAQITVVARGPKPIKVLREYQIPVTITVPEPNTWREILRELDENSRGFRLRGSRIAIQEYGVSNVPLTTELRDRGAEVMLVPVYRWRLPEDIEPLRRAIDSIIRGHARVILFTNGAQIDHVIQVAAQNNLKERLLDALRHCVVCSVGPTCSEMLAGHGITVDLEPDHPKMGPLVLEAAQRAPELLRQINNGPASIKSQPSVLDRLSSETGNRPPVSSDQPSAIGDRPAQLDNRKPSISSPWSDSLFMKACRRESTDTTPVWLMRQAGRYMKEYRELRAKVPFLDLCKNPDLVAEVTVTAAAKLNVDAAIIFADLLLIAEPLGFGLKYDTGEGPVITPALRAGSAGEGMVVDKLREVEPLDSLAYLYDAIRQTRSELPAHLPLIGFAGAPFTLASYLIEGGASKSFRHTKSFMYRDAGAWRALMEHLARNLAKYLNGQIAAGVQAVQIFDSWVGCLGPADYREFVLPYTRMLIQGITPRVPVIHFGTGTAALLEDMRDAGGDIIGLDARVDLDEGWERVGHNVGIQGNLDPIVLYAERPYIRQRVQRILDQAAGRPGHIFNLGHGILPETPVENVVALVEMVHELSSIR